MVVTNPFPLPGRWYKGNLHTHTTGSDGRMSPEEAVAFYRRAGYDFLAITDHGVVTQAKVGSDPQFLLMPGVELDGDRSEIGESFHVLGFGLESTGVPPPDPTVEQAIAWITGHGGAAVLAHPYWSGLSYADLTRWTGHLGIEVFNNVCEMMIAKGVSAVQWDDVLSRGQLLWGLAVDDCHSEHSAGYASIMVKATELTQRGLLAAIRNGHFYSTTGPAIEAVTLGSDAKTGALTVHVRTSPVEEINFMSQSWLGRHFLAPRGQTMTEATFTLRGEEPYVRIACRDGNNGWAWTNPVLFSER